MYKGKNETVIVFEDGEGRMALFHNKRNGDVTFSTLVNRPIGDEPEYVDVVTVDAGELIESLREAGII